MEDSIISVNTLLELLQRRIRSGKVRIREENGDIILTPVESIDTTEVTEKPKRQLGFLPGSLPESFFDPLPEEELQLWGL